MSDLNMALPTQPDNGRHRDPNHPVSGHHIGARQLVLATKSVCFDGTMTALEQVELIVRFYCTVMLLSLIVFHNVITLVLFNVFFRLLPSHVTGNAIYAHHWIELIKTKKTVGYIFEDRMQDGENPRGCQIRPPCAFA